MNHKNIKCSYKDLSIDKTRTLCKDKNEVNEKIFTFSHKILQFSLATDLACFSTISLLLLLMKGHFRRFNNVLTAAAKC